MIGSFILYFCIVIATFFFTLPCPRCDSVVVIHFVVACCPRPHIQFKLCTFNLFIIIMMVSLLPLHAINDKMHKINLMIANDLLHC